MSFSVPRNVPTFYSTPQQRMHTEDNAAWGASGRSRFPQSAAHSQQQLNDHEMNGGGGGGARGSVSEKIQGMFGEGGKELPMYKDKPYNYARSRRKAWYERRRVVAGMILVVLGLFYWAGWLGGGGRGSVEKSGSSVGKKAGSGGMWGLGRGKGKTVDWDERRDTVREAFKTSWSGYEKYAWGYDEYRPVSKTGRQMVGNGMGWIIVDALDTLILMNLTTELTHAREWMSTSLDYDVDHDVNTFETTIRMLGGLLGAHYLSTEFPDMAPLAVAEGSPAEDLYLEKANDLADRLLGAFDSASGVPFASINLQTLQGIVSHADGGASSTAEATTLQLEMKYLAKLTGEANYWEKAERVMQVVDDQGMKDGLLPIFIYADKGTFRGNNIRLGSRGDSYYEYLIKQYLQTSKQEPIYLDMWNQALAGIRKHLVLYSSPSNFTVIGERPSGLDQAVDPKMDHLVCFMPGTIALSATGGLPLTEARKQAGWGQQQEDDMDLAIELMKTCWGMYKVTATGLAPEITYFRTGDPVDMMVDEVRSATVDFSPETTTAGGDGDGAKPEWHQDFTIKPADKHNLQRPETVESLFYLWRITGDVRYREWGWEMFTAFVEHTAVGDEAGFSSVDDVTKVPPPRRDNMESFWLAETLKYFYLLFGPDDVLPLDQVVLNTEAHPLPRFEMGKLFKTGWTRKERDGDGNLIVPSGGSGGGGGDKEAVGEAGKSKGEVETKVVTVERKEEVQKEERERENAKEGGNW